MFFILIYQSIKCQNPPMEQVYHLTHRCRTHNSVPAFVPLSYTMYKGKPLLRASFLIEAPVGEPGGGHACRGFEGWMKGLCLHPSGDSTDGPGGGTLYWST